MQPAPEQSQLSTGMRDLKDKIGGIGKLIPEGAPLVYADFPIYQNFGDILIMLGTAAFLKQLDNPLIDSFSDLSPQKIRLARPPQTVWLLQGGGNFGDLWSGHQKFREQIILAHPSERVICLPQTMHYSSPDALKRFAALAAGHRDLHLFWRDHVSYETARRHFDCHNYLCPDMAHYLWPVATAHSVEKPKQDLFLMRRDKEGAAIPAWVLAHQEEFVDWRELVPGRYKLAYRSGRILDKFGGITHARIPTLSMWLWVTHRLMERMSTTFRNYDRIITSRLHAHIFACLLGSKSILIDNSYGKNRTYFDAWTRDLEIAELAVDESVDVDRHAPRRAV